jgi:hypothetical protein
VKSTPDSVEYRSKAPIVKAELNYTKDRGRCQDRKWESVPARLETKVRKAAAEVPAEATAWYINLFDDRDLVVSSEHRER